MSLWIAGLLGNNDTLVCHCNVLLWSLNSILRRLWQSPTRLTRNATHSARRATSDFTAIKINVRILGKYINKSDERRCRRQTTTNWNLKFAKQIAHNHFIIVWCLCRTTFFFCFCSSSSRVLRGVFSLLLMVNVAALRTIYDCRYFKVMEWHLW